jgi:mannose-6-phosphate isomerase-like protein (cupin superfamily)
VRCTDKDKRALANIQINPEDIRDDGINYTGLKIKKPWGYEVEKYKNDNLAVWWLHIHSRQRTSMHCHPNKRTLLFVIGGEAQLNTLNGTYLISDGDIVVIEKGAFHQTISDGGAVILYELETPANKRDLVRLNDIYGRGQGYERV